MNAQISPKKPYRSGSGHEDIARIPGRSGLGAERKASVPSAKPCATCSIQLQPASCGEGRADKTTFCPAGEKSELLIGNVLAQAWNSRCI